MPLWAGFGAGRGNARSNSPSTCRSFTRTAAMRPTRWSIGRARWMKNKPHGKYRHWSAKRSIKLRPVDKSIVVLSDMEGLPDDEIGAALRLTVGAVKSRLHRARLFL